VLLTCPLCRADGSTPLAQVQGRRYFRCPKCALTFIDPGQRPSPDEERAHYDTHQNDPDDPRYRAFLARLAAPLAERLMNGAVGLDYGSGPGPALAAMLEERGFRMALYDPFFAPDRSALVATTYDFITCTETAEHFFDPGSEFKRLDAILRPGGWLGVMTQVLDEGRRLTDWRYARDPTHVCFYAPETLAWIAGAFGWSLERPERDVALFRKPAAANL
jgi:SAM-dependent methyltransferase